MARGRRLKLLSETLFSFSPALALSIAERRGAHVYQRSLRRVISDLPRPEEFVDLFGSRGADELDQLARQYARSQYRLLLLQSMAARGRLEQIIPLVRWLNGDRLFDLLEAGKPAILTAWHAGPTIGIWAALASTRASIVRVQETPWKTAPPGWEILINARGEDRGAPIMKRCLKHLRSGGWTALSFDSFTKEPGHVRVSCLGRSIPVARGVVALAEMSKAPLIPLAARWTEDGRSIEVEVQEPIPSARRSDEDLKAHERRVLQELAARLETYLMERPYELNVQRLRYMLREPRATVSV